MGEDWVPINLGKTRAYALQVLRGCLVTYHEPTNNFGFPTPHLTYVPDVRVVSGTRKKLGELAQWDE